MDIEKALESHRIITEICCVAMQHDASLMASVQAYFERRQAPRNKNTDSGAAKKGPKNLLTAAASVQDCTV